MLLYYPSIYFDAVWGDDHFVISPPARDFKLMLKSFYDSSGVLGGVHYQPLFYFTCFVINFIFKDNAYPFGFHLFQYLSQAVICMLATSFSFLLLKNRLLSVLLVTLWTVHPINLQLFTRVLIGPAGMPSTACVFAYLYLFVKLVQEENLKFKPLMVFFVNILLFISFLYGEHYVLFVFLLYFCFFYFSKASIFQRKNLFMLIPAFIVTPIYLLLRYITTRGALIEPQDSLLTWTEMGGIKDILFRAFWLSPQLIFHHVKHFFYPFNLTDIAYEWYKVGSSVFSPYSIFCQLFVLALIFAAVYLRKQNPVFSFGILWFFLFFILVIQIIPLFSIAAIRYGYIPAFGFFLSLFSFVRTIRNKMVLKTLLGLILIFVSFLALRTQYYLPSSKDKLNLWIYTARESSIWNKPQYYAKALELAEQEKMQHRLPVWLTNDSFGKVIEDWIKNYLVIKPGLNIEYGPMQMTYNFYVYRGVFAYLYHFKRFEELKLAFDNILKVKNNWMGWYEIARFLNEIKEWQPAWESIKKATNFNPKIKYLYNLKFVENAIYSGNIEEAKNLLARYLSLKLQHAHPYLISGLFYFRINEINKALGYFKEAISRSKIPDATEAGLYYYAAEFFENYKMYQDAESALKIILSFDPFNKEAKKKLQDIKSLASHSL